MIDKDTIAEIKNSVNIVDVIGEVVALTKAGRNFLGLCPFHGEKTPSFNVVEDKQFFHCFGCGKSGDVFKFLEDYRGVSFLDSVQLVAERSGFQLQLPNQTSQARPVAHPHQSLYDLHDEAAKFYHALLMTTKMGEAARAYLHNRGLTDEVIKYFQLGLAPQANNYLWQAMSQKFDEATLLASGLFNPSEHQLVYDAFQNRIMFPLTDEYGRVVAFSGRIWTEADTEKKLAKYKNSRSTAIFNKSYEFYHLDKAKPSIKKQREVYLMEGFMDVIAAYRAGLENAVASMGTALTHEHVKHLQKHTKKVVVTYDGDRAGQLAIAKSLEELQGFEVEIVRLPEQMDPDEFISKHSPEALADFLTKTRVSDVEFLIDYLKPDNVDNLQAEIEYLEQIVPIIAKVKSITAQNSYIYRVVDLLPDFDYQQVEKIVNDWRLQVRAQQGQGSETIRQFSQPRPSVFEMPQARPMTALQKTENHLFSRILSHSYIFNEYRVKPDFHFESAALETLFQHLCKAGEISSQDLSQMAEEVQQAYYQVLEEPLPEDIGVGEMEELARRHERERLQRANRQIAREIRDKSNQGDDAAALAELTQLINQKRRME